MPFVGIGNIIGGAKRVLIVLTSKLLITNNNDYIITNSADRIIVETRN